jgi:hypothetical protein
VTYRVVFRPQAEEEARAARRCYEEQQIGLGERFADAIDEAILRIGSNPRAFPLVNGGIRRGCAPISLRGLLSGVRSRPRHPCCCRRTPTSTPMAVAPVTRVNAGQLLNLAPRRYVNVLVEGASPTAQRALQNYFGG